MRVFGTPPDDDDAVDRLAVYVVVPGARGSVAAVATGLGLFLPGGGAWPGESPEQTARRECLEELAREVRFTGGSSCAVQHFSVDGRHVRMEAVFLGAEFFGEAVGPREHELRWATALEAGRFFHASHAWAAGFLEG